MNELEQLKRENLMLRMELYSTQMALIQKMHADAAAALKAMDEKTEPVPLRAVEG